VLPAAGRLRLCRREKAKHKAGDQQGWNYCRLKTHYEFDKVLRETFNVKTGGF
jgi:hypothetical protein